MRARELLPKLKNVKRTVNGWAARCPSHDDAHNSLSVTEGHDGKLLLYCHAGCRFEQIIAAIEIEQSHVGTTSGRHVVKTYDYSDESGTLLFQACRTEPKGFFQRAPDGRGGWKNKLDGVRRVLYGLAEVLASDPAQFIFVCEGEKDVDALRELGLMATCNPCGAGKWRDEYNKPLRGRNVVLPPDNDEPGRLHVQKVARSLHGDANSVRIVELPGLSPKGDVSDWIAAGGTLEQLLELVESTAEYSPDKDNGLFRIITSFQELMSMDFGDGEEIAFHACRGEVVLIQSVTNHGKSTLTRNAAITLSTGGEFLSLVNNPVPRRVLLLNLEGAGGRIQSDLRLMTRDLTEVEKSLVRENFFPTHAPTVDDEPLSLSRHADLLEAEAIDREIDVIIVDTASAAFSIRNENDNAEVANHVMKRLTKLARRLNCLIILVHHIGKAKSEEGQVREQAHRGRGASAWADFAASIFNLDVDAHDKTRVTLTCGKRKDGEGYEAVLRLDRESRWLVATNEVPPKPKTNADLVVDAMQKDGRRQIKTNDIVKALSGRASRRTVMNCLKTLAELGTATSPKHGWWSLSEIVQTAQPLIEASTSCTNDDNGNEACADSTSADESTCDDDEVTIL